MNYFEGLSYTFGALMILTRPAMHLFPKSWNRFELNTAFISLTLIKTSQVLFNYQQFRKFVTHVLTVDRKVLNIINAAVFAMGVALILLGYFIYRDGM